MNQKDYKKIAEIIKANTIFDDKPYVISYRELIKGLADYFEEESNKVIGDGICVYCKKNKVTDFADACNRCFEKAEKINCDVSELNTDFNRKQFLKDCGVE